MTRAGRDRLWDLYDGLDDGVHGGVIDASAAQARQLVRHEVHGPVFHAVGVTVGGALDVEVADWAGMDY